MSQLIQSQYDKLDAVSQQFTEEYERIQRVYAALDARLIRLKRDGWIADAADGFYSSMDNDVMPAVRRLADALSEAARVTLQIKAVFQEAEEEAAACLRGDENEQTLTSATAFASAVAGYGINSSNAPNKINSASPVVYASKKASRLFKGGSSEEDDFSYERDVCSILPPALRGPCGEDHTNFRNLLVNFERGAYALRQFATSGGMWFYFNGHGAPVFMNPHEFLDYPLTANHVVNALFPQFYRALVLNQIDPVNLFNGQPITNFVGADGTGFQQLFFSANGAVWGETPISFHGYGVNMHSSIGTGTLNPTGDVHVTYEFTVNEQGQSIIRVSMTQEVELFDRYDWGSNEPVYVNSETGVVRLESQNGRPPVELNPVTNQITVLDPSTNLEADGFTRVDFPPDAPERGPIDEVVSVTTAPGTTVITNPGRSVFGTPDHPNPLRGGDFYSGSFHQLESEGTTAPYYIYSNWDQTIVVEVPYQIDSGGKIQISATEIPSVVSSEGHSDYASSSDPAMILLEESSYEPLVPLHEVDTRPH